MIKERLKDLEIKITELANYLQISRPTMYKYIDQYDSNEKQEINRTVLKLFDYIEANKLIDKRNVINYILNKLAYVKELENGEELDDIKEVRKYLVSNPDSEKARFIKECVKQSNYDLVIHFMVNVTEILNKSEPTDDEQEIVRLYKCIVETYSKKNAEDK